MATQEDSPTRLPQDPTAPRARGLILRSLGDFQTELFRAVAGWIPLVPRWELRRELSGLVFRDARRVQDLRQRCRELNAPAASRHKSSAVAGVELIEKLCQADDASPAFRAIFGVVKPRIAHWLRRHLQDELQVFDAPSIPVVEANLEELDRQITWAAQQPEICAPVDPTWLAEIESLLDKLPITLGEEPGSGIPWVSRGRKIGQLPAVRSVLPDGFAEGLAVAPDKNSSTYDERALFRAHNFFMEVQAADSCASLLFDAPDMPWDFYFDTARHMWDETRHCEFGELKLRQLGHDIRNVGLSNIAYVMRQTIDPIDRYAALTTQEADAFPGKHEGLRDALAQGDELSARAWSYDITDETQHVRYGRTWIPIMIELSGEPRNYEQIKRDAENWRRDVLAVAYPPARQKLGKAS